jgi:AmiR/NasT family two-component response regulator
MIELQSKVALSRHELNEFQVLKRQWQQYLHDLAKQKAQERAI